MQTQTTATPCWNNMLAQFGLMEPELPTAAPVSAKHVSAIHDNSEGLDELYLQVFGSDD
jgi:hypothetical protein